MKTKPQPKSEEYTKFEELARKIVNVPREDIKKAEKKKEERKRV